MNKLITPLFMSALLLIAGCASIDELKATKSHKTKIQREGAVNVASRATGVTNERVGYTTVLNLPVGSIKADGDTSANIMKAVHEALEAAGYNSLDNVAYASSDAAYLHAHVEDIRFGNFLASSWGTIILHLRLETRDGGLLWKKRVRSSVNALNNYDRTAVVTMNRLVKDMAKIFVEEDFYVATQRVRRHNEFLEEDTPLSRHGTDSLDLVVRR